MGELGKLMKFFNRKQETESPSGKYNDPLNVAIGQYKPGQNVKDMEGLLANTLSLLIYGKKNIDSLNKINGIVNNNINVFAVMTKTISSINAANKNLVHLPEIKTSINKIQDIVVEFATNYEKEKSSNSNSTENTLKIVLDSENANDVILGLNTLAENETLEIISKSCLSLIENKDAFDSLTKSFEVLSTSLVNILDKTSDMDKFISDFTPFIENLKTLPDINIDVKGLDNINNIVNELSNIDVKSINEKNIKNFTTVLESLGRIGIKIKENKISKEFVDHIETLTNIIPKIQDLQNSLGSMTHNKNLDKKIISLNKVLNIFSNIEIDEKTANNFKMPKGFLESVTSLAGAVPLLIDLGKNLNELNNGNVKPEDFNNLIKIINNLGKIKYNPKELKIENLNDIEKQLETLFDVTEIIKEFSNEAKQIPDMKKILVSVNQTSKILQDLDKAEFTGEKTIDVKALEELIKNAFPKIIAVINQLNSFKTDRRTTDNAKNLVWLLEILDNLYFSGSGKINTKALIKLNTEDIPVMIEISNKIAQAKIKGVLKNTFRIVTAIGMIGRMKLIDIDLKKLENTATAFKMVAGITQIASTFAKVKARLIGSVLAINLLVDSILPAVKKIAEKDLNVLISNKKQFKDLEIIFKSVKSIALAVGTVGIMYPFIKLGVKAFKTLIKGIKTLINELGEMDPKKFTSAQKILNSYTKVLIIASGCMLLGGMILIKHPELIVGTLLFSVTLSAFLWLTIKAISSSAKKLQLALRTAQALGQLIAISALVMIIGGSIVLLQPKLILGAMGFALALGVFLFAVIFAINLPAKLLGPTSVNLQGLATLIATASIVLLLGGTIVGLYPELILSSFMFAFMLATFLFLVVGAINLASRGLKKMANSLKDLAILIAAAGLLLIMGGTILNLYPDLIWGSIKFTLLLALFLFLTILAIAIPAKLMKGKKTLQNLKTLAIVIVVAAASLLLGGLLFTLYPDLEEGTKKFSDLLIGYIMGISIAMIIANYGFGMLKKGLIVMGLMAALLVVAVSSLLLIKSVMHDTDGVDILAGIGLMTLAIVAIGGLVIAAGLLNTGPQAIPFMAGLGVIGGISAIILTLTGSMLMLANAMEKFQKIEEINFDPIKETFLGLFDMVVSIGFGKGVQAMFAVKPIASTIEKIAKVMGKAAEVVANVASLKIPIYVGNEQVGYRTLTDRDFQFAANNTALIITTLIDAIIKVYNKNPALFDFASFGFSPLTAVIKTTSKLGSVISSIAKAVKDYASLTIPIYEGTQVVKYDKLTTKHFQEASKNVKEIITILSNALIDLYQQNPSMYDSGDAWFNMANRTPLGKVINVSMKLGALIASISAGVQAMASLNIPEYGAEGKIVNRIQMTPDQIVQAGENTKEIVTSLSKSLIAIYERKPELFETNRSNSKINTVVEASIKIGKLISSIAEGVQAIGNLHIITEWNEEGKPKTIRPMTEDEIVDAGSNVKKIVTSLATALIDIYDKKPELFDIKKKTSKIFTIIDASSKIGQLMSSIASGVQSFAKLQIPIKWNEDGKAIDFRNMTNEDIINAGLNVQKIVTILGESLMSTYEEKGEAWYGEKIDKSPFGIVMNTNMKLSKLISGIGEAVGNMAKLTIPIEWDKETGNPIQFRTLDQNDFTNAATNIATIISTLGDGIMKVYTDNKSWFEDEDGDILKPGKSKFSIIMSSVMNMGKLVSSIAEGVINYSQLRIPIKWDPESGKPIEFEEVGDTYFTKAGKNISDILTCVAEGVARVAANPLFDEKDSKVRKIMNSCLELGNLITNVGQAIQSFAVLLIPNDWNPEGKPIKFREMTTTDFTNAATNIETILTTIGGTIIKLYNDNSKMFNIDDDDNNSPFNKVATSCIYLGEMVKNIAEGISEMANIEATMSKIGIKVDYEKASSSIATVITTIGQAIMDIVDDPQYIEWFKTPVEVSGGGGLLGWLGLSQETKKSQSESPFQNVINCCASMGQMIISIAEGIKYFQEIDTIQGLDYKLTAQKIADVITAIGQAVVGVTNDARFITIEDIQPVMNGVLSASLAVMNIANLIKMMSEGQIAEYDEEGKVKGTPVVINAKTLGDAKDQVKKIITCIFEALNSKEIKDFKKNENLEIVLGYIDKSISMVTDQAKVLGEIGVGKIGDKNYGSMIFQKAGVRIHDILTVVAKALCKAYDTFYTKGDSGVNAMQVIAAQGVGGTMLDLLDKAVSIIANNAKALSQIASGKIDDVDFSTVDFDTIDKRISCMLTCVANGISTSAAALRGYFDNDKWENTSAYRTIMLIDLAKASVGDIAKFIANLGNDKYVYFDEITKGYQTLDVKQENIDKASDKITTIISSIAFGVDNGLENLINSKEKLEGLKDINFTDALIPVLKQITTAFDNLGAISNTNFANPITLDPAQVQISSSPIDGYINTIDRIIEQSQVIADSNIENSYKKLTVALTTTSESLNTIKIPDNIKDQTESLDKFIKSVNSVKVEGTSEFVELIRELNRLGVNMGNMDRLVDAITLHLNKTLKEVKAAMNSLDKSIKAETDRKNKHAKTLDNTVSKIGNLMNQTMKVQVEMADSGDSKIDADSKGDDKKGNKNDTTVNNKPQK